MCIRTLARGQWRKLLALSLTVVAVLVLVVWLPGKAAAVPEDWDIPGGHFFTQAGGGDGKGFSVTDEVGIRFWSEFKRYGGVQAVGYPVSDRFQWDGFDVQVFQRVIFQWRPEVGQAYFVNVFDRLHDLGLDDWLVVVRQTPRPRNFDDAGKPWEQVVRNHLAVLDQSPAIRTAYYAVVGDPIQANGLPTSDVVDMSNHFALRAQRVVFQQWKEDVPWAKAGQVTVALGGDIAKEARAIPCFEACTPKPAPATAPQPRYVLYFYFAPEGCPYCRSMASNIQRFYAQYGGAALLQQEPSVQLVAFGLPPTQPPVDTEVIAVPIPGWGTDVDDFKRRTGLRAPVGPDPGLQVNKSDHPQTVLYDRYRQIYRVATVGTVSYPTLVAQYADFKAGKPIVTIIGGGT